MGIELIDQDADLAKARAIGNISAEKMMILKPLFLN